MKGVRLYSGVAGSAREHTIDKLAAESWGHCMLVVPTRAEAVARAQNIVSEFNLPGVWGRRVVSLEDFALEILRGAYVYPYLIDEIERRLLFGKVIAPLRDTEAFLPLSDAVDSPGFVSHLQRVITKLKQAAVDPAKFREALSRRKRPSWLDPIVATVYEAYQEALNETNSYDRVGVYWRADLLLQESRPALFDQVRIVLFDNFDDFTPSEFRLIERVLPYVGSVVVGIAATIDSPSQDDLFAIPRRTVRQIMNRFDGAMHIACEAPPCRTRVQFVARELFWRSRPVEPEGLDENLQLFACHDIAHECELIGRRVKSLLVEGGVAPDEIAIVFRNFDGVASPLRLTLTEFQIPAVYHQSRSLADSTLASFLLGLLDVAADWNREAVLDTLTSHWFCAPAGLVDAFDILARHAGIIEGQRDWRECTNKLFEWLESGEGVTRDRILAKMPNAVQAARALCESVERLSGITGGFPMEARAATFLERMLELLGKLDLENRIGGIADPVRQAFERESLRVIYGLLSRMLIWEKQLRGKEKFSLQSIHGELERAFAETEVPEPRPGQGVHVVSPVETRQRTFKHVFLGGLNEGEFPSPPAADAIYTEEDYDDLDLAGAALEKRSKHLEREMLLLHHVLNCATESVTVTWHTVTGDGGVVAPSPFVGDLMELAACSNGASPTSTSFVAPLKQACSLRDVRNAPRGDVNESVLAAFPEEFRAIHAGVSVEEARTSRDYFGAYDGVLSNRETIDAIQKIYGPTHAFSAAQLETYAECPFQFFLQRILRVDEVDAADVDLDPMTRGSILHEVLQEFHQTFAGTPPAAIPEKKAAKTMAKLCKEIFLRYARLEMTVPPGILEVEHSRLDAQLTRYLEHVRDAAEEWQPTHFEVSFGNAHGAATDPLTTTAPFALQIEDDRSVLISGRIDRIDVKDGNARIIDYKATLPGSVKEYTDGVKLQLILYAMALEGYLMSGTACSEALLVQPGRLKTSKIIGRAKDTWTDQQATAREQVSNCVDGVRNGHFPPLPYSNQCYVCKSSRACRYEQWRVEMKSEAAP